MRGSLVISQVAIPRVVPFRAHADPDLASLLQATRARTQPHRALLFDNRQHSAGLGSVDSGKYPTDSDSLERQL